LRRTDEAPGVDARAEIALDPPPAMARDSLCFLSWIMDFVRRVMGSSVECIEDEEDNLEIVEDEVDNLEIADWLRLFILDIIGDLSI
jgi:hypothetical protein